MKAVLDQRTHDDRAVRSAVVTVTYRLPKSPPAIAAKMHLRFSLALPGEAATGARALAARRPRLARARQLDLAVLPSLRFGDLVHRQQFVTVT